METNLPVNEPIEDYEDNPIEQVRLTVPTTDDPSLPALTFRTWVLGMISCVLLAFLNQFFSYRQNALGISSVCAQIAALPLGKLMAATLPTRSLQKVFRNNDPALRGQEKAVECTRALNAAKLEKIFARPFVGAMDGDIDAISCTAKDPNHLRGVFSGSRDGVFTLVGLGSGSTC